MGIPFNISIIAINAQSRTVALITFVKNNFPNGNNNEKVLEKACVAKDLDMENKLKPNNSEI